MKYFFIFLVLISLSGCDFLCRDSERIVTQKVIVEVPCKIPAIDKPVMPLTDTGKATDDVFVKAKKAIAEIDVRRGYEGKLEAGVLSCQ